MNASYRDAEASDAHSIAIQVGGAYLSGELTLPAAPHGAVVLAQERGRGARGDECRRLANRLVGHGLATLVVDLHGEDGGKETERAVELAGRRLEAVIARLRAEPATGRLRQGLYVHEGTCAGAACLWVAADRPGEFAALALRGGCPERAGRALGMHLPPTLLIVPDDFVALHPARDTFRRLRTKDKAIRVAPRHDAGDDDGMAAAVEWFVRHLGVARQMAA